MSNAFRFIFRTFKAGSATAAEMLLATSIAWLAFSGAAGASRINFQHIVVIVQENRTPDNLFYALCQYVTCSTNPTSTQYDIQTTNWLDNSSPGGFTQPSPVPLATLWGPRHAHRYFAIMCDANPMTHVCAMDGANGISCEHPSGCPAKSSFSYVDNSTGILDPYLRLAGYYGWANYMFQTNQGPSYPAHQFIFGGSSAPSAIDDHHGIFASENVQKTTEQAGCAAPADQRVQLIDNKGTENPKNTIFPCFERTTLSDLLGDKGVSWRYYAYDDDALSIWDAPNSIQHICVAGGGVCTGNLYTGNVDPTPADILNDIGNCNLRQVSWVTPLGAYSDHAGSLADNGGPDWVASIVNAVGNSTCKNADGSSYWDSTAILITWDDWGGWYDHEPPTVLPSPEGAYQYGFRVPFLFVSAYTPPGLISNARYDFGSILRTIERNFGIQEGALTFADHRAANNLSAFYDFTLTPRTFTAIPSTRHATDFIHDKRKPTAPDDD
jgi:phospholipase C